MAVVVEKQSKVSDKPPKSKISSRGGFREGAGRPKGSLDKGNKLIREMVVEALDKAGGVDYLRKTALTHQAAFLALLGRVLPVQVTGEDGGAVKHFVKITFE